MRKLTAGIFTVLLGAVSVNAADAAVASKGYVDGKVGANTTLIENLTTTVESNKTAADTAIAAEKSARESADSALDTRVTANETAITGLQSGKADKGTKLADYGITDAYTKGETDTKIADAVKGTLEGDVSAALGDYLKKTEAESLYETIAAAQATNEAQDDKIDANTGALTKLNGNETVEGSVAKSIADAISGLDLANTYETKGAAATALSDAKAYADGLAGNYDAAGSASAAQAAAIAAAKTETETQVKALADGAVKTNTDAIAAINDADTGILKQANKYTDDEIAKINTEIEAVSGDLSAYAKTADVEATYATKTSLEATNTNLSTLEGTVTNAETGLAATRTLAQKGVDDAAAAQSTANSAKTIAEDAIPAPTDDCENPTNKCVLTYNNSVYTWEVIERGANNE